MCTLTYLPAPNGGFSLVSSRDEAVTRGVMLPPDWDHELDALYPVDKRSGGTWIATSNKGITINLMNGGVVGHEKTGQYKHSRGLVPIEFLKKAECHHFVDHFDFQGLEPFTLVVVHHYPREVCQIIWTGQEVLFDALNPDQPQIWSSSTLYAPSVKQLRTQWYQEHLAQPKLEGLNLLLDFHQHGGQAYPDPSAAINMCRADGKQTVCISGIEVDAHGWRFYYHDLVDDIEKSYTIIS